MHKWLRVKIPLQLARVQISLLKLYGWLFSKKETRRGNWISNGRGLIVLSIIYINIPEDHKQKTGAETAAICDVQS